MWKSEHFGVLNQQKMSELTIYKRLFDPEVFGNQLHHLEVQRIKWQRYPKKVLVNMNQNGD